MFNTDMVAEIVKSINVAQPRYPYSSLAPTPLTDLPRALIHGRKKPTMPSTLARVMTIPVMEKDTLPVEESGIGDTVFVRFDVGVGVGVGVEVGVRVGVEVGVEVGGIGDWVGSGIDGVGGTEGIGGWPAGVGADEGWLLLNVLLSIKLLCDR